MLLKHFKSHQRAPITLQKPIESSFQFSKNVREFHYIHQPIGKRARKIRKKFSQQRKGIYQMMLSHFLKTRMKFKSYLRTHSIHSIHLRTHSIPIRVFLFTHLLIRISKMYKILKGHLKKLRLISGGSTSPGLFNPVTFRPF